VRTDDILESLQFYRSLGFSELEIGDAYHHKYAVVSDGVLNIGLHEREFDAPTITFVQPDLAKHALSMVDHGFEFRFTRLGGDEFNELGVADRDDHLLTMIEARTFNPAEDDEDDSLLGSWFELTLPVRDALNNAKFWAPLAPVILEMREDPTMHMRFDAEGAPLGLSESIAIDAPALCFKCADKPGLVSALQHQAIEFQKYPGFEGAFAVVTAPEGTKLFVFDEDFLGEKYEVEESDDISEFPTE